MKKLLEIWHSPYPFLTNRWRSICIASIIVALLIAVFQPFGISQREIPYKTLYLVGYGVVTAMALTFVNVCLPWCLPQVFEEKKWTLGKDVLRLMLCLLMIALGNWLYSAIADVFQLNRGSFYFMLGCVLLLAPIPIVITLLWNRNILLNKYLQEAQHINELLTNMHESRNETTKPTEIHNAQTTDRLMLDGCLRDVTEFTPLDFLYAESDGNYVSIHYTKDSKEKELLLRATMSQIEEAFSAMPRAVKCHRAFLVNIDKVEKVSGNAQGLRLRMAHCSEEVPVSRAHVNKVKQLLGNNL